MGRPLTSEAKPLRPLRRLAARGLALLTLFTSSFGAAASGLHLVPLVENLQELSRVAKSRKLPILLLMSQEWCPYCDKLKNEILNPMLRSGEYADRVVLAEFRIDSEQHVRDFDGALVPSEKVASRYSVGVTPTLLFLNHRGRELSSRLRGINTPEFFGFYVDRGIDQALLRAAGAEAREQ